MKAFFATLCLALLALPGIAQPARPTPGLASTAEVRAFTAQLTQVATAAQKRDTAALHRLFATEYRHYAPDNEVMNRKAELAYVSSKEWPFATVAVASPVTVNVYGPTAVTVAAVKFSGPGQAGKVFTSTLQILAVWVQRDGRWQVAVMHSKELPAKRTAKN
ncbi:nuclear transport factor 2 family protein [Hymenobacter sp. RP-2-7]|uniref:Nuclear transport factor 2 family protein n=1 Tax=Hymenobacter polaris TaxID=2682546 RepID=A0A7Y0AIH2_9BACT|nr:nuclear transport factor 2 family protein [Hymenobacter polaris]NML67991.1 nuclear transport factor 2 family protein [Hymenobacter polaris]